MAVQFNEALRKAECEESLALDDLVALLQAEGDQVEKLLGVADGVRRRYVGDEIHLRGLIEFSNCCGRQCSYCGLRAPNKQLLRYRMTLDEVTAAARRAEKLGMKTIVLQSGEDAYFTVERIVEMIHAVKESADVAVTLSIGERPREEYRAFRDAGADRYLLKHETADPAFYSRLHPDMRFENRIRCLRDLRAEGFQVGSGCMVGLPGQTLEMLARDILLLQQLDVDMAGIGPFVPHPDTPLGGYPGGSAEMALKMVALARIATKNAHIPATTALATMDSQGVERAFAAGANVVMPNFTPLKYKAHYAIYPNKHGATVETEEILAKLRSLIDRIGRSVGTGYGHSLKRRESRDERWEQRE
ncbi:MAG: [FeFe] hydrogenase H-cluster radical SAM maturase HydE [Chloroflexota bacterium]|jgi:biotin synthase